MCVPRPALSIALTLLATASLCAQNDCRQRTVPVTVFDRKTGQIVEPGPANFKATYRGKTVGVTSAAANSQPPRVILLLDVSASTTVDPTSMVANRDQPDMMVVLSIAGDLLSRLPQPTEIGLAIFAEKMERLVSLTSDRNQVVEVTQTLQTTSRDMRARLGGGTGLWDAIAESVQMLGSVRAGDAIYAITDGSDNSSSRTPQSVAATLESAGIRFFRVETMAGPSRARPPNVAERMRVRALDEMAQATGGRATALSASDLRERLDLQYRIVRNFSRLRVELPEPVRESVDWRLELTNMPGKNNLELVYPHKLPACN
jgi:von Willebrand factor type A domain